MSSKGIIVSKSSHCFLVIQFKPYICFNLIHAMTKSIFLETHNLRNSFTGLGTFNYELIKAFSKFNLENYQLIINTPNTKVLKEEFGNKFCYHKYTSLSRHSLFRIRKKYDLWHSVNQNTKVEPFYTNQYLLTVHDVHFVDNLKLNKIFEEKLKRSTAINYISEFVKKETHEYFNIPNIPEYVIYNGNPISTIIDTSDYIPNVPVNKPFFYSISDFIERKNFISIIKMMKEITDFNLIISGNSDKEYGFEVKKFIINNQLQNKVFLTGKVNDIGKQFYMKNCTAFLFPSIKEGFGIPPIEAMAFGKPIFLSNKTSLPEIGGNVSNYWNNFDPIDMKKVLFEGLNEHENNKPQNELLLKNRAASFSWEKAANEYFEVYKEILY